MKFGLHSVVLTVLTAAWADFSYQETHRLAGGGAKNTTYTIHVKGNLESRISAHDLQIIDTANETVTNLDLSEKTYTVMAFVEIKARAAQENQNTGKEGRVDVRLQETGKTTEKDGSAAKGLVMTVKVGTSEVDSAILLAPASPRDEEVSQLARRVEQKIGSRSSTSGARAWWEPAKSCSGWMELRF